MGIVHIVNVLNVVSTILLGGRHYIALFIVKELISVVLSKPNSSVSQFINLISSC